MFYEEQDAIVQIDKFVTYRKCKVCKKCIARCAVGSEPWVSHLSWERIIWVCSHLFTLRSTSCPACNKRDLRCIKTSLK